MREAILIGCTNLVQLIFSGFDGLFEIVPPGQFLNANIFNEITVDALVFGTSQDRVNKLLYLVMFPAVHIALPSIVR